MRYCGQLGDERFDCEVVPRCRPRYIGQERFYLREDLDALTRGLPVDRLGGTPQAATEDDWKSSAMTFVKISGIKFVRANGSIYRYHRATGKRIAANPDTHPEAFFAEVSC